MLSSFNASFQAGRKKVYRFRYYRFRTTAIRSSSPDNLVQLSELVFLLGGTRVDYTGATASNPGGSSPAGEDSSKAIDNNTATKWLDTNRLPLIVDFATSRQTDAFQFYTANDSTNRDPVQWVVEGSNDNSTWKALHTQSTNANIPTARFTATQIFYFT
jgi:hypothetical protein